MTQDQSRHPLKQAVVLIHGIGEQKPMATLWKLVELAWVKCPPPPGAPARQVYSEPDDISGIFELRRLSTGYDCNGRRTDFFEYYWAHLMHGTELGDVMAWLAMLAGRKKNEVPPHLHKAWGFLRAAAFLAPLMAFLLLGGGVMAGAMGQEIAFITLAGLVVAGFVLLIAADQMFFSPVLGDAARYLRPSPKNVSRRQEIRDQGLKLIEALHETGKYDRIVLVGHSLGGVIAYELIVHLWGRRHREMDQEGPLQDVLAEVEEAARALDDAPENAALFEAWRAAQARFFDAVRDSPTTRKGGKPWLISDLVTLGCPLAHADTVMAKDPAEFALLKQRREILTSPPWLEPFADGARRFSYCRLPGQSESSSARPRAPHNSAAFAAVRWTNLYFPMEGLARGDLIAGPCRRVFGPGLRDVAVRAPHKNGFNPHMDYFSCEITKPGGDESMANHIEALRAAIGLEENRN